MTDAELIFRNQARSQLKGETFEELYRNRMNGHITSVVIEEKFARNNQERTISFGLTRLAKFTNSGRGPGKSGAEGKTCALQARN